MSSASRPCMIVPDVARGMALLGIAMANMTTAWVITTDRTGSYFGGIIDGSAWDKAAVVFSAFFVHNRGLPMFSTLLGFGVGLIALSLWRRGFPVRAARRVIAKRYTSWRSWARCTWCCWFGATSCFSMAWPGS